MPHTPCQRWLPSGAAATEKIKKDKKNYTYRKKQLLILLDTYNSPLLVQEIEN